MFWARCAPPSGLLGAARRVLGDTRADVGVAHRSVWGRSSSVICLCLSAWRRSFSAEAQPWLSPLFSSSTSSDLPERRRRLRTEQKGISAPSSRSNPSFHFTLGHDCNSSLPLRAAEQEMNSTHSFPKFPSPSPPSPPLPPPPTGREGCRGLMGNVVLRLPNVLNTG